jgi:hypothetical protein
MKTVEEHLRKVILILQRLDREDTPVLAGLQSTKLHDHRQEALQHGVHEDTKSKP